MFINILWTRTKIRHNAIYNILLIINKERRQLLHNKYVINYTIIGGTLSGEI